MKTKYIEKILLNIIQISCDKLCDNYKLLNKLELEICTINIRPSLFSRPIFIIRMMMEKMISI